MSVNQGDRKQSKIEVIYQASKLHEAITALCLRSFGVYSRNSPFRRKYNFIVKNDEDREEQIDRFIKDKAIHLEQIADQLTDVINAANAIFPRNSIELEERLRYQTEALATCNMIRSILNDVAYEFDVDINCFREVNTLLNLEAHLIAEWRKSDKSRFKRYFL